MTAADTDEEARRLFTSHQQAFVNLRRGRPAPIPPPDERFEASLDAREKLELEQTLSVAVIGGPDTIKAGLDQFVVRTGADELIVVAQVFNHAARLRSYELVARTSVACLR